MVDIYLSSRQRRRAKYLRQSDDSQLGYLSQPTYGAGAMAMAPFPAKTASRPGYMFYEEKDGGYTSASQVNGYGGGSATFFSPNKWSPQ